MDEPVLRVENLIKQYDSGFTLDIPQLEFHSGRIYAVVGPNGAGKTTLLHLLNLLEKPTEGELFFNQERVTSSNSLNIRRQMNMIMEDPLLFHTTVFKNIASGLKFRSVNNRSVDNRSVSKKMWPQMISQTLKLVGLTGFEKRHAPDLSRGESQRVAIARALVLKPKVLFLDEPFTNIDQRSTALLENLIKTINQEYHPTIILTTHDLGQAYRLADEVISLVEGRVISGSLENLFSGEVEEVDGLQFVRISAKISLKVVTEERGKVQLCIPPRDIILSHRPIESSARNSYQGIIKKIQLEGQVVRLNILVDTGVEFIATVTKTSYDKLGLSIDADVFLTFKSTAIMVL